MVSAIPGWSDRFRAAQRKPEWLTCGRAISAQIVAVLPDFPRFLACCSASFAPSDVAKRNRSKETYVYP